MKSTMFKEYTKKLFKCSDPDEVWSLMSNRIFPNSNYTLFGDKKLEIRKNSVAFRNINVELGEMELAYRTVLYLMLDGEMGDAPKNSGCYHKADKLKTVIKEMQDTCNISILSDINHESIDTYILNQREKVLNERSIYKKLYLLFQWHKYNYLLPHFLRLPYNLFEVSIEWKDLVKASKQEHLDYLNGIGYSKEPYPLNQLAIIVIEALEYIEKYADDCIIAGRIYNEAKSQELSQTSTGRYYIKVFRSIKHKFKEPQLKNTQEYALSLNNERWITNKKVVKPMTACIDSVHKLQTVCIIIILMITAMRKGELEVMNRYPKVKKTMHHELDGSFELERLIYKTAETEIGESHTIAVPFIVVRAFDLLSQISEISDGKQEGTINLMSLNIDKEVNGHDRIRYLIIKFCDSLDVLPPTPHQFRHAMAFLVTFLNDDIGIELAMTLLGHKSIEMTKAYMGHYKQIILKAFGVMYDENKQMQEALTELQAEQSLVGLEKIIRVVEDEEPMAGPIAKRLLQGFEFSGSVTDDAKAYFAKSQRLLLERGMLAIVEHPTHFCVRDLTKSEQMPCQIGLSLEDFTNAPVISAQCQTNCGCRLYTEPKVEYMKELAVEMEDTYPNDISELLKGNRYYIANSSEQHYANVIDEFESIKQDKNTVQNKLSKEL